MPPRRKKPAAGEKFGNPFFCAPEAREKFSDLIFIFVRPDFHFGPIPPLKKFGDDVWSQPTILHWELKGRPALTFWIAYVEQLDFLKKYNEICNMGSVEDQKRTCPLFSGDPFTMCILYK